MSKLSERTIVNCAVSQASLHLARYVRARGNSEGDVARLSLRAEVPLPGKHGGVQLMRTAIATLVPRNVPGETLPHYTVTWAAEGKGPYPRFAGDLTIEHGDDYECFYLVLEGRYDPPLGAVGAAFDAVVGHRIAESTARNLLATIADSIEADFLAVETSKADARKRVEHPA